MTSPNTPDKPVAPPLFAVVPWVDPDIDKLPPPDNGPYYVVAKDKVFVHKKLFFGRALTKVTSLPHLGGLEKPEWNGYLWYDIPKMPAGLLGQAWSFFKKVYQDLGTEAMVYITHHPEKGYRFFVPPQWNTGGHVNAKHDAVHIDPAWKNVGTIHSHCNFSAFHSGTDENDANQQDGLHITIGNVLADKPSYALMISVAGIRWKIELTDVTDEEPQLVAHPEWWHRYVSKAEIKNTSTYAPYKKGDYTPGQYYGGSWQGFGTKPDTDLKQLAAGKPLSKKDLKKLKAANHRKDGWDPAKRHFVLGNHTYTGLTIKGAADAMVAEDLIPTGWKPGEFLAHLRTLEDDLEDLIETVRAMGISVDFYASFDEDSFAEACALNKEQSDERSYDSRQYGLWTDEDELKSLYDKPLHTLTEADIAKLEGGL